MSARPVSSFRSVADMWAYRVGSTPRSPGLSWREGGQWRTHTWAETDAQVRAISAWMLSRGIHKGDRAAILAHTGPGWVTADLAILSIGAVTTTLYPTSTTDECRYILADSGATLLFCDTVAQARRVAERRAELPALRAIVVFDTPPPGDPLLVPLYEVLKEGAALAAADTEALESARRAVGPDDLATLIYTSGTTGVAKGVMLTHDAWIYESEAIDKLGLITPADKQLLFLPLAHVFARVMELSMVRLGVPTALDGNADRLGENLVEVRPTFFAAVPRLFERALDKVMRLAEDQGPAATLAFQQAVRLGREVSRRRQRGEAIPPWMRALWQVADRLVYGPVKERFGGRIRFMVSGGAPLSREVAETFHAFDLLICEGYGLTESTAASTVNTPDDVAFGTVGRPLPGCEVRIAPDGEILLRSRGVMKGYWNQPESTAEALDADGWLHTGDIGRIRDSGHLEITDRKKDLIVTAQGKNVAPQHVQGLLRAALPLMSQAHVHGDRRPFCAALITIREDELRRWAAQEGLPAGSYADLCRHPAVRHRVQQAIDDVNHQLPPYERIRKFEVLDEDFTVDNGLLTASLKPRRKAVEARWASVLDGFYEGQRVRA